MKYKLSIVMFGNSFIRELQEDTDEASSLRARLKGMRIVDALKFVYRDMDSEYLKLVEDYYNFIFGEEVPTVTATGIAHVERPLEAGITKRLNLQGKNKKKSKKNKKKKKDAPLP